LQPRSSSYAVRAGNGNIFDFNGTGSDYTSTLWVDGADPGEALSIAVDESNNVVTWDKVLTSGDEPFLFVIPYVP
jgi:hypothetical protein